MLVYNYTKTVLLVLSSSLSPLINSTILTMDAVRLQHMHILLSEGGGSRDEEAEQMVHQVCMIFYYTFTIVMRNVCLFLWL